ncbi:hypothetical protein P3X46_004265 [Hevea brasiliensis]|uniref:Transcription repressor n=1 Tax=Hevea brasiliensis TaxID=3981 RepID=A0ABQ9MZ28_HEVBR|nr:transcription repressor OFP6-like [Hevea brasiliensis]KAJ9184551.1 hypothetical protein P3X46_004265 [Hevea brasiliensis]
MSTNKKRPILRTVSVSLGCSSCKKPILSNIFKLKPRPRKSTTTTTTTTTTPSISTSYHKHYSHDLYYSSSTSSKTNPSTPGYDTTISFSSTADTPPQPSCDIRSSKKCSRTVRGLGRIGGESLAVEKDSDDPYLDFRQSMLQMILEKEIYSKDDLRELLNCFLQLNSPYHHGIIVRAFTDIWDGVYSARSSAAGGVGGGGSSQSQQMLHYNY